MESPTHSIEIAIEVVRNLEKIGFIGLRTFLLAHEDPQDIEDRIRYGQTRENAIDDLASGCWHGQSYAQMWLGDCNITIPQEQKISSLDELEVSRMSNGVYYMQLDGNESHYWTWIVHNDDIWYIGTYGGVCELIVRKFNKLSYSHQFRLALEGDMDAYENVFGIDYGTEIKEVGFEYIIAYKSTRYN